MQQRIKQILKNSAVFQKFVGPYVYAGNHSNQWLRVVMNRETRKIVDGLNPSQLSVLEISGDRWSEAGLFRSYKSLDFPEFDVCKDRLDETFDLIVAEQVFEHLLWPYRAARNVFQMLKPNGHFLITTPFLVRVHPFPTDCTRWTETGMQYFLAECGFSLEDVQTGSWGNRDCVRAHLRDGWRIYQPWRHSIRNEKDYPLVVWALAQKRDADSVK
jgi:SAM-dependent methyltransferase